MIKTGGVFLSRPRYKISGTAPLYPISFFDPCKSLVPPKKGRHNYLIFIMKEQMFLLTCKMFLLKIWMSKIYNLDCFRNYISILCYGRRNNVFRNSFHPIEKNKAYMIFLPFDSDNQRTNNIDEQWSILMYIL